MKNFLTLLIAFSGSLAFAKFTPPADVAQSADAPSAQVFEAGSNAALQLTFSSAGSLGDDGDTTEECSGTAISNDGYIITALHCLSTCASALSERSVDGGTYYQTNTDRVSQGSVACNVSVRFKNKSVFSGRAQILAAGRGFIEQGNPGKSPAIQVLINQGIGPINDYAVIKLKRNPAAGCLKTEANVTVGEKVWNMAYPTSTSRHDGFDAPGEKVMFSSGVLTTAGAPLQSTIDIVHSSSGSGLFNYNGQLIALSNSVAVSPGVDIARAEVAGVARSTPISHIVADASSIYGSSVVNQAFNCY